MIRNASGTAVVPATLHGGVLQVVARRSKNPPLASVQEPGDNIYVRQLPIGWTEKDLYDLFRPYGAIQECKVLHRGADFKGGTALVRMQSADEAMLAILSLNGQVPASQDGHPYPQPLLLRYADGPEEKARKLLQREVQASGRYRSPALPRGQNQVEEPQHSASLYHTAAQPSLSDFELASCILKGELDLGMTPLPCPHDFDLDALQSDYQTQLNIDALLTSIFPAPEDDQPPFTGSDSMEDCDEGWAPDCDYAWATDSLEGAWHVDPPAPAPAPAGRSLYVKNLPSETDDLWVYERFSPHGPILGIKVLHQEGTTRCQGVCFVNYTTAEGALAAVSAENGRKVGDKTLHVSIQSRI